MSSISGYAHLIDSEPGRLIRLRPGEEIIHIDPHLLEETEKVERRLGVMPYPVLHELAFGGWPADWTYEDEVAYTEYVRGFYSR